MENNLQNDNVMNFLSLEDSLMDFEIIREMLIDSGFSLNMTRVEREGEFTSILESNIYDIILADFNLPGFNAFRALEVSNQICPDVPFICISGAIGEETAIELLKKGAVDFVMKNKLERLPFVIRRAIDAAKEKKSRMIAEEELRINERRFRHISSTTSDISYSCRYNISGRYTIDWMTGATERITGYTTEEIIALQCWGKLVIDEDLPLFKKHISSLEPGNASSCELRLRHKNGGIVWVASYSECSREEDEQGDIYLYGALVDITNRKEAEGILTDIINKNPISIQILDENGYTLQVNPANEALFGVVPPPHFNIFDALIQKDPELGKLISLARSGQVVNFPDDNFNVKDIHPENPYAPVWIKTVLFPLKDKDGKPIRFVFMHENITDRRKAEETIRESQASLEEAQIIAKTGNWDYDLKTKKVTWSKNYYRMIGLEPGEVNPTYELFTSHVHPDDLHLVSDASKSNFRSKEAVTLELRFILADGSIKWFQNKSVPFFENNVLVKMKGVITDITERKQAEEKLKVSENKYRYLVENALVGIYTTTIDGNLIYANEALRKMMEFDSVDEFIDFGVKSTYKNTDERDIFVRNIIDSRQVLNRELELVTKKGKTINVIVSSFVSGEVIIGMMMDITERKEAEEVIKASEENYHKLYNLVRLMSDTMPDMIWAKDLEKKFIFVNKSLCDNLLIAKDTNEPIGKTDLYFAERERKAHTENPDWHTFGKLCMDSDTVTLEEMKEMQFDEFGNVKGKYLFLDVHKAPLHNVNGELIGVVGSARDITLRKQAQEILQQKMTELQRFYDVTVDRELFMIELKKEVNDLMKKAGLGEKYKIVK